jgi:alpha-glucuronidase
MALSDRHKVGSLPLRVRAASLFFLLVVSGMSARAEDGYDLWLRYVPVEASWKSQYEHATTQIAGAVPSATLAAAQNELSRGLAGLLGTAPTITRLVTRDGAILIGTSKTSPQLEALRLNFQQSDAEGYIIRSVVIDGHRATVIAANTDTGVLYGVYHFLRRIQTREALTHLDILATPRIQLRILNHWDNLNGTVERGYAGASLWNWQKLPDYLDPRYTDYARACASVGINGTVLTNVNANVFSLAPIYLRKIAALAKVFRTYGLRVYLSAPFSAPVAVGGLKTADPFDAAVKLWWKAKADEIYALIPDFGGFLVKANSEGQPGPQDYGRSHADGANMLAEALAPHGGVVMWRAFVYNKGPDDRTKKAYAEFVPQDGHFAANVLLQVKYGPIDFQPREPISPLFGAMPHTPLMLEVQITKEYLGFATHLAYLAPLWQETLTSDTYANGAGSTVGKVIDGSLHGYKRTGMAGVANIGADRNWTGSQFDQANWYAFGRLAWDPTLQPSIIAREWVRMTFSNESRFTEPVVDMMMKSREAVVDYMTPLGLSHQMSASHFGPAPWLAGAAQEDTKSLYFSRADSDGIGFDRTATGSNAVAQYAPELAARFSDLANTPEKYLLWFHHVPWSYRMTSGKSLWDELVGHYAHGVRVVSGMRQTWQGLGSFVDADRYAQVSAFLAIQEHEAQWWRDANIAYFQSLSKRPLPADVKPPAHSLDYYKSLCLPVGGDFPTCSSPND